MSRKTSGRSKVFWRRPVGSGLGAAQFLWVVGLLLVLAVVVSVVLVSGLLQGSGRAKHILAPDITVATTEGDFRISEQRGSIIVLYYSFPG